MSAILVFFIVLGFAIPGLFTAAITSIFLELILIFLFLTSGAKLAISAGAITQSLYFSPFFSKKDEIKFSEIDEIEENNLNPIIQQMGPGIILLSRGGTFFQSANTGFSLHRKGRKKPFIIFRYQFDKNWDELKKIIEEKSGKKIKTHEF